MIAIGKALAQVTRCHGTVNGQAFELNGGGDGRPFEGVVNTRLRCSKGALPFPTALLSPVLIMGYPTFSNYHRGAFDLFKLSNGYEYERHFEFENGGRMNTMHRITYHGDKLSGDFHVTDADVKLPDIVCVEPTVETFVPAGPGKIQSSFVMAWQVRGAGLFRATVRSEYRLTHNAELPYLQFRYIAFDSKCEADAIEQTESLHVFRDLAEVRC
jgi:actin beta/gamma 1